MSWFDDAACKGMGPGSFYPDPNVNAIDARKVCAGCPVRDECLEHAVVTDERWGVWGGLSVLQRRGMGDRRKKIARCGTESGYKRHLRMGEPSCHECMEAQRTAKRERAALRRGAA